jgi:putative transposase
VIGWTLADHLGESLAIEALDMALTARPRAPPHRSVRGVQYASADYCDKLAVRSVLTSISRVTHHTIDPVSSR